MLQLLKCPGYTIVVTTVKAFKKRLEDFPVLQTLWRHLIFFFRFIFLCKQLVGLCCKLPCPVMIMIMIMKSGVMFRSIGLMRLVRCTAQDTLVWEGFSSPCTLLLSAVRTSCTAVPRSLSFGDLKTCLVTQLSMMCLPNVPKISPKRPIPSPKRPVT